MKRCVATKAASALPSNTASVERSWPPENATLLKYCLSGIFTTLPPKIDSGISEPEVLAGSTSSITEPFTESTVVNLEPFLLMRIDLKPGPASWMPSFFL